MADQKNNTVPNKPAVRGWIEVLYRRFPRGRLDSARELDLTDYDMVGSPMPLSEFDKPVEVLDMLTYGQCHKTFDDSFAPRCIAEHDIVNLVRTQPSPTVVVSLLVVQADNHQHLKYKDCQVDLSKNGKLAFLQLEEAMGSVVIGNN